MKTKQERVQAAAEVMSQNILDRTRKFQWFQNSSPDIQAATLAEHSPKRKLVLATQLIEAIDEKRVRWLLDRNNGMWDSLWRAFSADTGIKLPSSQKGIGEQIRCWAGDEAFEAAVADMKAETAARIAKAEAEMRKAQHVCARRAASAVSVNQGGVIVPGDRWVDQMLAEGWRIQNRSTTRIPSYVFVRGDQFVSFRNAELSSYARRQQQQLDAEKAETIAVTAPQSSEQLSISLQP